MLLTKVTMFIKEILSAANILFLLYKNKK